MKTPIAVLFISATALGAGFRIDAQSSRATAMGSAVSALVDDASSNFYNPAGLTAQGKGFEVQVGDTLIFPSLVFTEPNGMSTSSVFSVSPPPHVYLRAGLFENVGIGIGVFAPFGASGDWPEDWVGQFRAHQSSLQTFDFNPNIAWRPVPRLSLGAGVNVVRGTVVIARHLDFVESQGEVTLGGGAWGVGWNGGVQVEMIEKMLTFAGTVRSGIDLNFTGAAHFEGIPPEFQSRIYDQKIQANISLPMVAQFGLGARPFERLRLGLDVTFVGWSSFQELRIAFENDDLTVPLKKKWWDTASLHLGGEFDITSSLCARLGFVYDPTPSPANTLTPDLPDATRLKFAAGGGWKHKSGFFVDLAVQIVALLAQESTAPGFPGTYSGSAGIVSLTVGYRLGGSKEPEAEAPPPASEPPPAEKTTEPAIQPAPEPAPEPRPAPGEGPVTP